MAKRRMKKARAKFISLVPRGANQLPVIYKEKDANGWTPFEVNLLLKEMSEQGELLAVVYSPEFRDSDGDIASAEVIKEMAYSAAKEGVEIDIRHDGKPVARDRAFVAEHFLVQKDDPRFVDMKDYNGSPVDVTGAWAVVLKIDDEGLRQSYRDGKWNGVSMGGAAAFVEEKEDRSVAARLAAGLERLLKDPSNCGCRRSTEEETMAITQDDLEKIAKATAEATIKAIEATKKQDPPKKPDEPPASKKPDEPQAPVFKDDPTDLDALKAHREELRKFHLQQRLDKATTTKEFDKILAELEKKDDDKSKTPEQQEIEKLQDRIKVLKGGSNQGAGTGADGQPAKPSFHLNVTKEEAANALVGSKMAEYANALRGK